MGALHGHRLRHAGATGTLEVGGTLIEPRDLHVRVRTDTTMIYARKDLAAIRSLTNSWIGLHRGAQWSRSDVGGDRRLPV